MKMAAAEECSEIQNTDLDSQKVPEMLDRGWKIFEEVDNTNQPTGSNSVQVKVKRGMQLLEEVTRMVAQLDLFSRNEELEEIATTDLKYLMLPALLGALTMKQVNLAKRLEQVQQAKVYFLDFLRRCKDYNIMKFELPKTNDNSADSLEEAGKGPIAAPTTQPPNLIAMATQRQAKIERYKQKKEAEAKLSEIKSAVESGHADDEMLRDFYILSLRKWITIALEEIESIDQEIEILKQMDFLKQEKVPRGMGTAEPLQSHQRPPMKPFILTKDAVQARVFGAGYPSLPTMTVNDWYEQHRKHGVLPDQGIPRSAADIDSEEREKEEKERQIENDDEEALQKARDWDNWKDTHRRGYGNRKNMG
ncbi:immunoglobulin-binding protein 1 [Brienomyrus brachyistius]|uniref:immunoglobulin-binding protein 1 n=1 Tax=Brienomyrus brachyistius TaxID=42636 RepID=UPI0020B1E55C|nr:immunoglobulin-binding protein 1 [Brienomyrus brachyistius]